MSVAWTTHDPSRKKPPASIILGFTFLLEFISLFLDAIAPDMNGLMRMPVTIRLPIVRALVGGGG